MTSCLPVSCPSRPEHRVFLDSVEKQGVKFAQLSAPIKLFPQVHFNHRIQCGTFGGCCGAFAKLLGVLVSDRNVDTSESCFHAYWCFFAALETKRKQRARREGGEVGERWSSYMEEWKVEGGGAVKRVEKACNFYEMNKILFELSKNHLHSIHVCVCTS